MKSLPYFSTILIALILSACQSPSSTGPEPKDSGLNLEEITIDELQQGYRNKTYSIQEVVTWYLDRIKSIDQEGPGLNSVLCVNPEALEIARALDREMAEGKIRGPMHGVPVLLKDNIDTKDKMPTTAGSRALANSYPLNDSWVAASLRAAGAVILGKANLSEWANFRGEMSTSGWSAVGGQTHNPYDLSRNPCGSSSGSGAAVSANLCMVAIGTETNGSIVCPSSANGIAGIKPTVGLVSRSGIIPISFTQDTPGPMARTLADAAVCLGVLTGVDSADSKTWESETFRYDDYIPYIQQSGLEGKRIGWYTKPRGRHYKVDKVMEEAVRFMKDQGATVMEIDKLYDPEVGDLSFQIMLYEYKDGLNAYFESLGPERSVESLEEVIKFNQDDPVELNYFNQELMHLAQEKGGLDSPDYQEKLKTMLHLVRKEGLDKVMDSLDLDAIIAPTGGPAWKTDHVNGDAYHVGSSSPAAIAGYPNITVPMGFIDGLPVGISFFGRAWSEPLLLEIASSYESGTQHRKAPEFQSNEP
jgi:amidase